MIFCSTFRNKKVCLPTPTPHLLNILHFSKCLKSPIPQPPLSLPLRSHECKPHLRCGCSLIALSSPTAHPNDIKQAHQPPHTHKHTPPPPFHSWRVHVCLNRWSTQWTIPSGGHRGPRSASAVKVGRPRGPEARTCLGLDTSPPTSPELKNRDGVVNLHPE